MAPSPKKKKDKANVKPRNWLTISQKLEIFVFDKGNFLSLKSAVVTL